ncbi:MAG: hypothetical protein HFH86_00225 [Bacilli bacterium]|jgi:uncharacterized protein YxjI|nr:hypothetical protein [Bacilli bacterium]
MRKILNALGITILTPFLYLITAIIFLQADSFAIKDIPIGITIFYIIFYIVMILLILFQDESKRDQKIDQKQMAYLEMKIPDKQNYIRIKDQAVNLYIRMKKRTYYEQRLYISDQAGHVIYKIKQKYGVPSYLIYDPYHEVVGSIKKSGYGHYSGYYDINLNGVSYQIQNDNFATSDLDIKGNFYIPEYRVLKNGQNIGEVKSAPFGSAGNADIILRQNISKEEVIGSAIASIIYRLESERRRQRMRNH